MTYTDHYELNSFRVEQALDAENSPDIMARYTAIASRCADRLAQIQQANARWFA